MPGSSWWKAERAPLLFIAGWAMLLLAGYPADIALGWDEVTHAGTVFHYQQFWRSLLHGTVTTPAWADFGDWGAGLHFYPPAYSYALGLFSLLFGEGLVAARLNTVVHGAAALWFLVAIARRFVGPRTGLVAALMLATYPIYWVYARRLMLDIPQVAFELGCFYYLVAVYTRTEPIRRGTFLALAVPWFAVAALTRITGALFVVGPWLTFLAFESLRPSSRRAWRTVLDPHVFVPLLVVLASFGGWLLLHPNVLGAHTALLGERTMFQIFRDQNLFYLRWLFWRCDPVWGLAWLAGVVWSLYRRTSLHLLVLATFLVVHVVMASLFNPTGADLRYYLPAMPLLSLAAADLFGWIGSRATSWLAPTPRRVLGWVALAAFVVFARTAYARNDFRQWEARSTGVPAALRQALPLMRPTSWVAMAPSSGARVFLPLAAAPNRYQVEESLGASADPEALGPYVDYAIFDTGEFSRAPHLAALLAAMQASPSWRLLGTGIGSPTEWTPDGLPTAFVFARVDGPPARTYEYEASCIHGKRYEGPDGAGCALPVGQPGVLASGPYWGTAPGRYRLTLRLSVEPAAGAVAGAPVGEVVVARDSGWTRVHVEPLTGTAEAGFHDVSFEFENPVGAILEFVPHANGAATVRVDAVRVERVVKDAPVASGAAQVAVP